MNIKIQGIVDTKNLEKERVILKVTEDDFLGAYLVFKTKKIGEKQVSSRTEATFWFPDKQVQNGDLVVLYTKVGTSTERKNTDGTTTHFFYWFLNEAIWSTPNDTVLLARLQDWDYQSIDEKGKVKS